jgi:DNA-binding NarL/FixJ family response regulator
VLKDKIRIILADDHRLLRSGLKLLLGRNPNIEFVGEASDGETTLQLFEQLRPDILILDLSMPKMGGMDCLKEIKSRYADAKIIVLTMYDDEEYIKEAMKAGAAGYVHKGAVDTELFKAIDKVQLGELYLSPRESQTLLNTLLKSGEKAVDEKDPYVLLSTREREVLKRIVYGYSLSEIAEELSISIKTVETYKIRVMEKLDISKKSGLVDYALRYGLLASKS